MARWLRRGVVGFCLATKVARARRGCAGGQSCRGMVAGKRAISGGTRRRQNRLRRRRLVQRGAPRGRRGRARPVAPARWLLLALAAIRDGQASLRTAPRTRGRRPRLDRPPQHDRPRRGSTPPRATRPERDWPWPGGCAWDATAIRAGGRPDARGFLGDTAAADDLYATALTLLPRLAADPYWQDPERSGRWAGIEAAAGAWPGKRGPGGPLPGGGGPRSRRAASAEVDKPGARRDARSGGRRVGRRRSGACGPPMLRTRARATLAPRLVRAARGSGRRSRSGRPVPLSRERPDPQAGSLGTEVEDRDRDPTADGRCRHFS